MLNADEKALKLAGHVWHAISNQSAVNNLNRQFQSAIDNRQSAISIANRQSQSAIGNLNRQSAI